jgi:hypothetical protein
VAKIHPMRKYGHYIERVFLRWFFIFASTIAFTSGVAAFFSKIPENLLFPTISIGICFIVSVVVTLIFYPIGKFLEPIENQDDWLYNDLKHLKILFPYDTKYLRPSNKIARLYYGKNFAHIKVIKNWFEKNPLALSVLADPKGKIVGYFDILPLTREAAQQFIEGSKEEHEITGEDIFSPTEMNQCEVIYYSGIAVANNSGTIIRAFAGPLFYASIIYLEKFYDFSVPRKVIALPVTDCGIRQVEKHGFRIETEGSTRKDNMDLYSRMLSQSDILNFKIKYGRIRDKIDLEALITYEVTFVNSNPTVLNAQNSPNPDQIAQ